MVKASDCGIYPDTRNTLKVVQIAPFFIFPCSVVFRYTSVSKHQQIIKALHCCCYCWHQESGRLTTKIVSFCCSHSLSHSSGWLDFLLLLLLLLPYSTQHYRVDLPLWELGLGLGLVGQLLAGRRGQSFHCTDSPPQSSRLLCATVLGNRNFARTCRRLPA